MHFYYIVCVTCPTAKALELSSSNLYSIIEIISYLMLNRNRMKLILKHAYDLVNFVKVAIE